MLHQDVCNNFIILDLKFDLSFDPQFVHKSTRICLWIYFGIELFMNPTFHVYIRNLQFMWFLKLAGPEIFEFSFVGIWKAITRSSMVFRKPSPRGTPKSSTSYSYDPILAPLLLPVHLDSISGPPWLLPIPWTNFHELSLSGACGLLILDVACQCTQRIVCFSNYLGQAKQCAFQASLCGLHWAFSPPPHPYPRETLSIVLLATWLRFGLMPPAQLVDLHWATSPKEPYLHCSPPKYHCLLIPILDIPTQLVPFY